MKKQKNTKQNSRKFKIRAKRRFTETDKALIFSTMSYGGRTFVIPKSQVLNIEIEDVPINSVTSEPWLLIEVTEWIWNKAELEPLLEQMTREAKIL